MSNKADTYQEMQLAAISAAKAGDLTQSLALFDQLLELQPDSYQAWGNRANVLDDLGRTEEAVASYDRALQIYPGYEIARSNRGVALQKMANEVFNQGVALDHNKQLEAALACYERALSIDPMHRAANLNAALVLEELGRLDEAAARFINAERIDPGYVDGLNRAGDILSSTLGKHQEALEAYDRSLMLNPNQRGMRWNRSHSLLALGRYAEGWPDYEAMRNFEHGEGEGWLDFAQPQWRGESLAGKRILLWSEQGFGDVFQFCRYVPIVRELGATVFFLVHPKVQRLFEHVFAGQGIHIILGSALAKPFDYQCPLMGLPAACKTKSVDSIPACIPYLWAEPSAKRDWQERLTRERGVSKKRIGLVWASGYRPTNANWQMMDLRSLRLTQLALLVSQMTTQNMQVFSLQMEEPAKQLRELERQGWAGSAITDITRELNDWADTAAVVANLDLVITTDTALAHLSASMGKPTWIMLHHSHCWRWLQDRDDSPWYPTVRLFRQNVAGDWDDVVRRVAQALKSLGS